MIDALDPSGNHTSAQPSNEGHQPLEEAEMKTHAKDGAFINDLHGSSAEGYRKGVHGKSNGD